MTATDGVGIPAKILNSDGSASSMELEKNGDHVEFPLAGVNYPAFSRSATLDTGGGSAIPATMIAAIVAVIAMAAVGVVIWRRRSSRSRDRVGGWR